MPIGYWDSSANDGFGCYIDSSSMQCTSLDSNGTGDYNGLTYYYGDPASGYIGYLANSQYTSGGYFVSGVYTTLNNYGNGSWNSQNYVDGSVNNSGWSTGENIWYYNGSSHFGVDSSGNGYSTASLQWFIAGTPTTLDSYGSGFWNNHAYYYGSLQPNGYNGYYYYLNDVQTTLDSSGNGTWNGVTYASGVAQIVGTKFVGSPGDSNWDTITNWTDDLGNVATLLPDGNSPITVLGATNGYNMTGPTTFPSMIVSGGFSFAMSVTISSGGKAVFKNGAILASTTSISGDVEFQDTAYMESGSSITGNVTFKGRSVNKNDISGTVTAAHGGGINGSNILGFA